MRLTSATLSAPSNTGTSSGNAAERAGIIDSWGYPQYEHAAVIVAEEITSRFLNVIQLFNGAIPLIAIKMTAYKLGDQHALAFVKVLDEMSYGLVDEDEDSPPADRGFWETKRGNRATMATTDELFKLVKQVEPKATLKYNRHYIGLEVDGSAMNFVTFIPRKAHLLMTFKQPHSQDLDEQLEEAGIDALTYDSRWRQYRVRIPPKVDAKLQEVLLGLIRKARETMGE